MKTSTLERLAEGICARPGPDLWFSDVRVERIQAATLCLTCPALDACQELAATRKTQEWGVWAGIDRHPVSHHRAQPKGHEPATCQTCTDLLQAFSKGIQPRGMAAHLGRSYGSLYKHLTIYELHDMKNLISPPEGYWK